MSGERHLTVVPEVDPTYDPQNAESVVIPVVGPEVRRLNFFENMEARMRQAEAQSDSNWPLR